NLERTIQEMDMCRDCKVAMYCGGFCALEALNKHGDASQPRCKDGNGIVENFLDLEEERIYRIGRKALEEKG
ncbi:MAG: hypothetical protein ABEJ72_00135, partial [Candidatus Aenigmatarchaeota archaeon]